MWMHCQDEEDHRPFVSRVINHLANYQGGVVPNVKQQKMHRADSDVAKSGCRPKKKRAAAAAGKKAVCAHLIRFRLIRSYF